jgi:hypothetical protein
MKRFIALALGLVFATGLMTGCGSSGPSQPQSTGITPSAADVAQVNAAIAANAVLVNEDVYESNSPTQLDAAVPGMAAIRPMFWWRRISSSTRTFDTEYTNPDTLGRPTQAVVSVHKHLVGTFNILVGDSTATPDSIVHKPLDDRWERRLLLRRVAVDSLGNPIWRLVGSSGVQVTSEGALTHIVSVRVQSGRLDTTVTDPLQMHRLRRVLRIPSGIPVTVTVTTGSPNDVVVYYRKLMRGRFHNNGDNTYTASWITPDEGGFRHFGVNALSNGTLFDDTAPYDSQAWIFPYSVRQSDCDLDEGHHDDDDDDHEGGHH